MQALRASGKPAPAAWLLGCGKHAWFSAVSGIEIPVPSTSFTLRPRQRHAGLARALTNAPTVWARPVTIAIGKRSRALQQAPVRTLCGLKPSAQRCGA